MLFAGSPAWLALTALTISVLQRCINVAGSTDEACRRKEEMQETDETKGIHDFNVCQLNANLDLPDAEVSSRFCTAHLVLVEGKGQFVAPATCFLPSKTEEHSLYVRKHTKGWAFQGKVSLTCGPDLYTFDLQSTFKDAKVLLHPEFVPEKRFLQAHNIAVIRITPEDYQKATEAKIDWEFARLSEPPQKGPAVGAKCRCYAGVFGAPGDAEPPEYEVELCKFPDSAPAEVKANVCFRAKESLASNSPSCAGSYCGMKQSMSCFCGTTADELRKLHSVGSFLWKGPREEFFIYSVPLKSNWEFLHSSIHEGPQLGATDGELRDMQGQLSKAMGACLSSGKGDAAKSFIKEHFCDGDFRKELAAPEPDESDTKNRQPSEFEKQLKEFNDCMHVNDPRQPNNKQAGIFIPPVVQVIDLVYQVADEKVCKKSKILETMRSYRNRLRRRMRCFSLVFRQVFKKDAASSTMDTISGYMVPVSVLLSGGIPGIVGGLIWMGCDKIDKPRLRALKYACRAVSGAILSPTAIVGGVLMSPVAAVMATKATVAGLEAASKINR